MLDENIFSKIQKIIVLHIVTFLKLYQAIFNKMLMANLFSIRNTFHIKIWITLRYNVSLCETFVGTFVKQ